MTNESRGEYRMRRRISENNRTQGEEMKGRAPPEASMGCVVSEARKLLIFYK
jgi:hypothetical protein